MVKRVLMIAYHFPPVLGSSGVQRTLKFSHYLPRHGWHPIVLSVRPSAYPRVSDSQLGEIDEVVRVRRTFAIDVARHLAINGKYLDFLAWPDRWATWWLSAVPAGLALIRRYRPEVIFSTFPIATAHCIGATLARLTGLPWVADFRDPMTDESQPTDPRRRRIYERIERFSVARSTRVVVTTPGMLRLFGARYPEIHPEKYALIANAYDEENFRAAEQSLHSAALSNRAPGILTLLHSGLLYPVERDPRPFFQALRELRLAGKLPPDSLRVVFRAAGEEEYFRTLLAEYDLKDMVDLLPPIPYDEAIREMFAASALLIFQASNCNHQVPAKLYEYLRVKKPILAVTDPEGDTATVLREAGAGTVLRLDSAPAIRDGLPDFLRRVRDGNEPLAGAKILRESTRQMRTEQLVRLLDSVVSGRGSNNKDVPLNSAH